MNCKCDELVEIEEFGGYSHYESTKKALERNVSNGYMKTYKKNRFEQLYVCNQCKREWVLAEPDFPAAGYFVKEKSMEPGK